MKSRPRFLSIGLLLAALTAAHTPTYGVLPQLWTWSSWEDLSQGEMEATALSSTGEVVLAPHIETLYEAPDALILSLASDNRGNKYLGSGRSGAIYRIGQNGEGSLFFQTDELQITDLKFWNDHLYAISSPEGKLYRINRKGEGQPIFVPDEKYLWALDSDRHGNIYVATGEPGRIYKIDGRKEHSLFYESDELHIKSLTVAHEGLIYAGSAHEGRIYKIRPPEAAFVLYDSAYQEVTDLAIEASGTVYAALISIQIPEVAPPKIQTRQEGRQTEEKTQADLVATPQAKTQSAILRVDDAGLVEKIWSSSHLVPLGLALHESDLLVGTGNSGKLLRLNRDGHTTLLTQVSESQITSLEINEQGGLYLGTSNLGALLAISMPYAEKGIYSAPPRDAGAHAVWGTLSWEGDVPEGTSVRFLTRSGNSASPDKTWSTWSGPLGADEANRIESPASRFLQWKAELISTNRSSTPRLRQTKISYLPKNVPPTIKTMAVHLPGVIYSGDPDSRRSSSNESTLSENLIFQGQTSPDYSRPLSGKKEYRRGLRTISWQAEDQNSDRLLFHLYIKQLGRKRWNPLERDIEVNFHQWDTHSLPDGEYVVKLVAVDSPSNPAGYETQSERLSDPFYIDHTPPRIRVTRVDEVDRSLHITFSVQDTSSPIHEVRYSTDFGPWHLVFPEDLIADSLQESYALQVPLPDRQFHTVTLRATDWGGNSSFHRIALPPQ